MTGTRLLQDGLARHAEERPEARAVVFGRDALSYRELEEESNRLAWQLREAGCRQGDRVCVLLSKSPDAIVSLFGIYKAGAIFVPLDTASPAARLARILRSAEPRFLLARRETAALLQDLLSRDEAFREVRVGFLGAAEEAGATGVDAEFSREDVRRCPPHRPECRSVEDDPAHILFTSGSTGDPKGVVVTHRSVLRFVEWATRHFGIAPGERVSGHSPLHFDLSTFDIFGAFEAGAELHLVAPELNLLPSRLADLIRSSELTQWFSVPSVLTYMASFDIVRQGDFPALRRLLWCGEVFPTRALVYWMRRLPHVAFTNLYGPTEAAIASSYYDVPGCPSDERTPVPIGRACDGEELLVLDEALRPVPPQQVGELYIRGVGLSPGYWRDPEKTRAAFVPGPSGAGPSGRIYRTGDLAWVDEGGLVHLVGRSDSQVKSRGYRIELGEIESALHSTTLVQEALVTAIATDGFEGNALCCAYVPAAGRRTDPAQVRLALAGMLPGYMLPSRWMSCDRLPRNANGKLDRRTVKEAFEHREALTSRRPSGL